MLFHEDAKELVKLYNSMGVDEYLKKQDIDIFHYTSPSVLNSILSKNRFWFTDRQYLNDKTEGLYVLDNCINLIDENSFKDEFYRYLREECKNRKKMPSRGRGFYVYQISFSYDEDNLGLWNYYTRGEGIKGYNLKFKSNDLLSKLNIKPKLPSGNRPKPYGGKVIYNKEEQDKIVYEIIDKFRTHYDKYGNTDNLLFEWLVDKLLMIGTFFKPECFSIEKEYRIIIDLYINKEGEYDTIANESGIFERNGYLIPYIEVEFNKSCLQGITVSPTMEYEDIRTNILNVTIGKFENINQETISKSKITLLY